MARCSGRGGIPECLQHCLTDIGLRPAASGAEQLGANVNELKLKELTVE